MNAPYRRWAERLIRRRLLGETRWHAEVVQLRRLRRRERFSRPGWGGEGSSLAGLLARMLVEEHMACRLAVSPVLPRLWRHFARHFRRGDRTSTEDDPFGGGLRALYRLYEAARWLVRRA